MGSFMFHFSGLCGFVPHPNRRRARVLLVDARNADPRHFPVLKVLNTDVETGTDLRDPDCTFRTGQDEWALFRLDDEEVRISTSESNALRIVDTPIGTCEDQPCCPDSGNRESINWVAPMERISKNSGAAHRIGNPIPTHVIARVTLTRGTLKVTNFAAYKRDDGEERIIRWIFKDRDDQAQITQALADIVTLELPTSYQTINLETKKFRNNSGKMRWIRLKSSAEAFILNQPMPSIKGKFTPPADDQSNPHFRHLYDLSNSPGPPRIPYRDHRDCPNKEDRRSAATPFCPPALFNADPDA